jgi:hypothetical protein
MRRFAIDSDRVYLTGHFAGGDAAWDIGISFPDVWAGVVPISAAAGENGKYASSCHEAIANHNLGFRFVSGQLDLGRIVDNKIVWNKWMQSPDFDVTVVEYRGRLAETFAEELPNIFRWMARHKRILATEQFSGRTLRPWVRQFWWVEVERLAAENVVLPHEWPPREKLLAQQIEGKFQREKNKLIVSVPKSSVTTVWILPELVDFGKIVEVTARGIDFRGMLKPSRNVLLEDVRRRADRQHPYWAKLVCEKATWRAE